MKIIAALVLTSACATTARSLPSESPTTMMPRLDMRLAQDTGAKAWFPALASDAVLPSVAQYQKELSSERDRYELAVRVCVMPSGQVASVELTQASGSTELDRAIATDIKTWQFEAFHAPAHIRVCKPFALGYEPTAEMSHIAIPLVRTSRL